MTKISFPLAKVYGLLEPGPVVLVTTSGPQRPNIMTMSWHTMLEFEPPLLGCVISNSSYTFGLLQASGQCVINIPTVEIAEQVVACGNCSGAAIDKFATFGLTATPAELVRPPLIAECFAHLECRLADPAMVEKYCFFVLEVIQAWHDPAVHNPRTIHHRGNGLFMVGGDTLQLPSEMK